MAGAITKRKEDARVPALAMANKFGRYNPETEKTVRDAAEVAQNPVIEAMKKAFWSVGIGYNRREAPNYKDILETVKKLEYTAKDVEFFSIALVELEKEYRSRKLPASEWNAFELKTGLFLSALINNGKERGYTVHVPQHITLECLCYRNSKEVTVNGQGGHACGGEMTGGSITVNGDAGHACGKSLRGGTITVNGDAAVGCGEYLKGGAIIVHGSVGRWCGERMRDGSITVDGDCGIGLGMQMDGGTIIVKGDAEEACGRQMKGGEIRVEGTIAGLWKTIVRGKIYEKGKLIVDK